MLHLDHHLQEEPHTQVLLDLVVELEDQDILHLAILETMEQLEQLEPLEHPHRVQVKQEHQELVNLPHLILDIKDD